MEISMKTYILTIEYNEETEEVEYIGEELLDDNDPVFTIGEIDLADIFDRDTLKLIKNCYEIGES
tara:strand:- start:1152 stop:1346 length:195 start_codon:yes stop_codon:yes gene_type:complete